MNPTALSLYEFCPRSAQIAHEGWEREQRPVRDEVKRAFLRGVEQIRLNLPRTAANDFLSLAAARGFTYPPNADPYVLANDCAAWVEGALAIATELPLTSALVTLSDGGWDSLLFAASGGGTAYRFHLPSISSTGRLHSVLTCAYRHPLTGVVRLATFDEERGFSAKWRRIYRWESLDEFSWEDWRAGITADDCMGKVYTEHHIPPLGAVEREILLKDAERIEQEIGRGVVGPRLHTVCDRCEFEGMCHGDGGGYIRGS